MKNNNSNPMKDSKVFQDTMRSAHCLYKDEGGKYHYEWSDKVASDTKLFHECLDKVISNNKYQKTNNQ